MSLDRFEQLKRFLRFDDWQTRELRQRRNKLAPMGTLWQEFLRRLPLPYQPSKELTIDEQLLTTHGKVFRANCSFRQYIPHKLGKYGINIFWLVDDRTNYPLSAGIYVGQESGNVRANQISDDLVLRLMAQ